MSFTDSLLQDPYKRGVLIKGAIGMCCVVALAAAVSFFGDNGKEAEKVPQDTAAATPPAAVPQKAKKAERIPAKERFDYSRALELPAPEPEVYGSTEAAAAPAAAAAATADAAPEPPPFPALPAESQEAAAPELHEPYEIMAPALNYGEDYSAAGSGSASAAPAAVERTPAPPAVPAPVPKASAKVSAAAPAAATRAPAAAAPAAAPKAAAAAAGPAAAAPKPAAAAPKPEAAPRSPGTATASAPKAAAAAPAPAAKKTSYTLYCGSYTTRSAADEHKALLAFQGLSSRIVKRGANFALALGPYSSREQGRKMFTSLDARGLVSSCSLE